MRAALALAAGAGIDPRGGTNLHAILNLLNRLNGTPETEAREELITHLAEYLTAAHRIESSTCVTLSALCELARSYAAMRYLMVDAIGPRMDPGEREFSLHTVQAGEMMDFLQCSIDSLLDDYVSRVELRLTQPAWWQVELTLTIEPLHGAKAPAPAGWEVASDTYTRTGRFTARASPLPAR